MVKVLADTRHVVAVRVEGRDNAAVVQVDAVVEASIVRRRRPGECQLPRLISHRSRIIQGFQFILRRQAPAGLSIDCSVAAIGIGS